MKLHSMVWKEILRRPGQSLTALLIVALGVSALVAVESVVASSEQRVASQMQQLGANILILPEGVTLQDYHAADAHGRSLPEEYVTRITLAQKVGVEELAPKLSVPAELGGDSIVVTGILPRSEFYKKSAWQSVDLLTAGLSENGVGKKHEGCGGRSCQIATTDKTDLSSYATTRIVHELDMNSALVGADLAKSQGIKKGQGIRILGASFRVEGILPATGTSDDGRVLAHLHRVQELADTGPIVNVIEVMGCCEEAATDLVGELDALLPDARVVTISQIVQTQVTVNRLMNRLSYVIFGILMLIGGASIASVMFANVTERRRELGTLMALGATPGMISRMILLKASTVGVSGGVCGLGLGLMAAYVAGPQFLGVSTNVSMQAVMIGLVVAVIVSLVASYPPARKAAHLDPCLCFQDS
ncbi:MAG: FtsX-like permease family protein [Planctomycetaceae bacterium]|nr:FtsX-like permease family protein [Planctomycetaceae bacterium]